MGPPELLAVLGHQHWSEALRGTGSWGRAPGRADACGGWVSGGWAVATWPSVPPPTPARAKGTARSLCRRSTCCQRSGIVISVPEAPGWSDASSPGCACSGPGKESEGLCFLGLPWGQVQITVSLMSQQPFEFPGLSGVEGIQPEPGTHWPCPMELRAEIFIYHMK